MSTVTRCDKCGKEIKPRGIFNRILNPQHKEVYETTLSQELEVWGHKSKRYDLCADCYYDLIEWLTGDQTYGVVKEKV